MDILICVKAQDLVDVGKLEHRHGQWCSYHYTKITFVHVSVCDGKLPTFTENRVDPDAFLPLIAAWRLPVERYGKRQLNTVGRHDGKLRTCMEGE